MADTADLYGEWNRKSTASPDGGDCTTIDSIMSVGLRYLAAGLSVLPASSVSKYTTIGVWKKYQNERPTPADFLRLPRFSSPKLNEDTGEVIVYEANGLCVTMGAGSGNAETIDFDFKAELFPAWCQLIEERAPGLLARLTIERSQSGGRHVAYRCEEAVGGNLKLAERLIPAPSADLIEYQGKKLKPKKKDGTYAAQIGLIETRGQGGLIVCAPTPGYVLEQGSWETLQTLTVAERAILIDAAKSLSEIVEPIETPRPPAKPYSDSIGQPGGGRAGDDYNERGDVRELLRHHGWKYVYTDEKGEKWARPGKNNGGVSATLFDGKVFYCFSSNAGLEEEKGYPPFALFAALEHNNDYRAAAKALYALGYGEKDKPKLREELPIVPVATADDSTGSITLDQYRSAMRDAVIDRPHEAGCFALSAPPGVGKTTLLRELVMKRLEAGHDVLSLLPVHANIDEELAKCRKALPVGKTAEKYPPRKCVEEFGAVGGNLSDLRHVDTEQSNCQNPLANFVDECGLSVLQSVCNMGCPHRAECAVSGWLAERDNFKAANLKLATHKLAEMVGIEELAKECSVIIADEDPRSMLRPIDEVTLENVRHARKDLREVLDDPTVLSSDWLNPTTEDGDQAIADKATLEAYLRWLDSTVFDSLVAQLEAGALLTELSISRWQGGDVRKLFPFVFRKLNSTKWRSAIGKPTKSPWPCLYRATLDRGTQTAKLFSKVHESFKPAPNPTKEKIELRSLVTVRWNPPPVNVEMWFLDGTSGPNLEVLVGRPVLNLTPSGRIPRKHPAVQYTKDITHRTSPDVVVSLLRGFLADHPEIRKLGVFCHQQNRAMIEGLNDPRIAVDPFDDKMIGHFNSGVGRSSNKWHDYCDAILILGSPRTGPEPVRLELLRLGRLEAAAMPEPPWVRVNFKARDQRGGDVLFEGGQYANADWQAAHNSLCGVELLQTIGRGRGELLEGKPVFVFSNEPIGIPISDGQPEKINSVSDHCLAVLRDHRGESELFPKVESLGKSSESLLRTSVVAQRVTERVQKADPTAKPVSVHSANTYLRDLEARGLVFRRGKAGWRAVIDPQPSETPPQVGVLVRGDASGSVFLSPDPVEPKTASPNASGCNYLATDDGYDVRTHDGVQRPLRAICEGLEIGLRDFPEFEDRTNFRVTSHRNVLVLLDGHPSEFDRRVFKLIDEQFPMRSRRPLAVSVAKGAARLIWPEGTQDLPDGYDVGGDWWCAYNSFV